MVTLLLGNFKYIGQNVVSLLSQVSRFNRYETKMGLSQVHMHLRKDHANKTRRYKYS